MKRCFHPLAGKWLKKSIEGYVWTLCGVFVSIPLRGNDWKSVVKTPVGGGEERFPSPCGEMIEKGAAGRKWLSGHSILFPSPCGEMIEKGYAGREWANRYSILFPSPCGEMIEKVTRRWGDAPPGGFCFHPLAGKWLKKEEPALSSTSSEVTPRFHPLAGKWLKKICL